MMPLNSAIVLGRQGYACFFCREDKTPASPHGFKDAVCNPDALADLAHRNPGPLLGVATGAVSGVDVLDLDKKHPEACEWWAANKHRLPQTKVNRTKSGGLHLLFRHEPGLRCWTARPVVGIDGRADGGYVVWWPAAGLPVLRDAEPAPWPEWLLEDLEVVRPPVVSAVSIVSSRQPARLSDRGDHERYATAALRNAVQRIEQASEGTRNQTLNNEAFGLGRFVRAELLEGQLVADALAAAALKAGLNPREALLTLRSALRARGAI